jgi:hypothetical protein
MKNKSQFFTKTICIISTNRADFGLLIPLAEELMSQKNIKLHFLNVINGGYGKSNSNNVKIETVRTRESIIWTKTDNIKFIGSIINNLNKKIVHLLQLYIYNCI